MLYFFSGFSCGLITGVTFFIVPAYPKGELKEPENIICQTGWACGVALGFLTAVGFTVFAVNNVR